MERGEFREYLQAFAAAVILAAFVITFIAQSFHVQGRSMEPTMMHGERLLVDKLSYRFADPSLGDIVVFRYPADPRRRFIKRILGLPGDELAIRGGLVYRNGRPISEAYAHGPTLGAYNAPSYGPVTVPAESYFVLGDNRRHSDDSRYPDVGFVKQEHIVGRVLMTYWPLNQMQLHNTPHPMR